MYSVCTKFVARTLLRQNLLRAKFMVLLPIALVVDLYPVLFMGWLAPSCVYVDVV